VNELLVDRPVWFKPTDNIRELDGEELSILQGNRERNVKLRVVSADPDGKEQGKVAVMAWQVTLPPPDEMWHSPPFGSKQEPPFVTHQSQQFLTRDGLDSVRRHSPQWPEQIKLELVIPEQAESFPSPKQTA
jgi:hypothetical protein